MKQTPEIVIDAKDRILGLHKGLGIIESFDENNPKIIELLQKLQKSGAKEVIVSASASNTGWGPNPA